MTLIAIVDFHDCGKITAVDFEAIGTFIELKHHVWKHLLPHASQSDIQIWRLHDALSIDEAPIVLEKNHLLKIASKMDSMTARVASEIYVVAQSPPAIYFLAADGTHPSQDIEGSEDSISEMSSRFSKLLSDARLSKPLSKLAKSSDYRVWQKGESPVYDGRFSSHTPTHTVGPPVELFYEGFAEFIENIQPRSSLQLPSEFARDVSKFMSKVSGIYENEAAFKSVILPPLEKVLGRKLVTLSNSDRTTPDLAFLSRLQRILGLAELKRDIGEGGCDASTQASLSVLRYWAQAENEPAIKASCCPTYVFALSGPWLVILGAVITSRCIVQRLTDYLWLGPRNCLLNDEHVARVARVLLALKHGLERSEKENNLETQPPTPGQLCNSRFFPHIASYTTNEITTRFVYIAPLERDGACVTFHCRTIEGQQDIVVKFVKSYGDAAQRLLATADFAPKLLHYGNINSNASYSGVKIVVMELVKGKNLGWLQAKKQKLPSDLAEQLKKILRTLHGSGFVHGDLRPPNVVVTDDIQKVQLVDFDWAAMVGEAFYPINLSGEVQWPPRASGLGSIDFAHDQFMLEQIVRQLA